MLSASLNQFLCGGWPRNLAAAAKAAVVIVVVVSSNNIVVKISR